MKASPTAAFSSPERKTKEPRPGDSYLNEDDFHELDFCFTRIEFPGVMPVYPTKAGTDAMSRIACPVNRDWRYTAVHTTMRSG